MCHLLSLRSIATFQVKDSSKDIFLGKLKEIKQQSMEMLHGRTDDNNNVRRIKKLLHKSYNNMEFCLGALGICGVLQASHILLNGDQVDRKELIGGNDNSTDNGICDEFLGQITSSYSLYCERDGAESALSSMEVFEAFVHPSYNRHNGGCYQRLEFLGDAVLDYLITSFLYSGFPKLKPGQLTDLRSVLVNNSTFAKIAIKHSFHTNILCDSHNLLDAIDKYVKYIEKLSSGNSTLEEPKCPKALGDLVESCFGAILLDTGFNLNLMWRKMFYFLSPVMKFTNLQVNAFRELTELCQYHKWDLQFISVRKNKCCTTEAKVEREVEGELYCWSATATYSNAKLAYVFKSYVIVLVQTV